jgi:gluconate 2-dehydrogenase subunit 3-like protein
MKRRNFVQSLLIVPAASVAAEEAAPPAPAPQAPPPTPRPVQNLRGPQNVPKLALVEPDSSAEIVTSFFNPVQFATLNKLAEILVPPIKNNPGAIDAHAPEFLDFLISRSPAPDQKLYCNGLDGLNTAAQKHFHKPFAELDAKEADSIIRPLLIARAWDRDIPKDPMQHFLVQVHENLRTATMNSAEWAASGSTSGRGRFNQGRRFYWKPIDPRVGA